MTTAVVTGGAGFIGSHLVDELVAGGGRVVVLDNLSTGLKANVNPAAVFVPLDLTKAPVAHLTRLLSGADSVWHLAANVSIAAGERDREIDLNQNVFATCRLLEACSRAGVGKFFFTSSSAVYGNASKSRPAENKGPLLPISLYGASKLAAEGFISAYCDNYGMSAAAFRLANVVGARQRGGIIPDLLRQRGGDELRVLGDGTQRKSYVRVGDCVEAMLLAAAKAPLRKGTLEIYNIGSSDRVSVGQIARSVARAAGFGRIRFKGGATWAGDIHDMVLDTRKMRTLGWQGGKKKSADAVENAIDELMGSEGG